MSTQNSNLPPFAFSTKARRTREQPISQLISVALANPDLISLAAGLVDQATLPTTETADIMQRLMRDAVRGRAALQYDTTQGFAPLRQRMLQHIESLEGKPAGALGISADDILVTNGSQQGLYLIADVLVNPGDIVIAANPSYFVFGGALQSLGARVVGVPMDDDGMVVEQVEAELAALERAGQLDRVRFVYCTSFYQNPTGLTLSLPRRKRLLEIVRKYSTTSRILVLEDAAYRELRYDGDALPSIKSFDPHNQFTVLAQTFSKPFAPGFKTGYTAMPRELLEAVLHQKGNHDFGSNNLSQHILLEAMNSGEYARHVETLKTAYRAKRDAMLDALERHMPEGVSWTRPHGGLYVWATLPAEMDVSRESSFFGACVQAGVLYVPGDYCFAPDASGRIPLNHMRLSFGHVSASKIDAGVERLSQVVRAQAPRRSAAVAAAAGGAA